MSSSTLHAPVRSERILELLRNRFSGKNISLAESPAASADPVFLSRCILLQGIGASALAALWIAGVAAKPFQGDTAILCWIILGIGAAGIVSVFRQRWDDVHWIATHVVRIGLLGTVIGLIIAFSAAATGNSTSPEDIKPMISAVVSGMYVSLYATLLGISVNLWLKINLKLLANFNG